MPTLDCNIAKLRMVAPRAALSRFAVGGTIRTCFRCGRQVETICNARLCSICRKPREVKPVVDLPLTPREKQVIALVKQAKGNKGIAWELKLTEGTIKEYMNRIFRKLGVGSRTELAVWAVRQEVQ